MSSHILSFQIVRNGFADYPVLCMGQKSNSRSATGYLHNCHVIVEELKLSERLLHLPSLNLTSFPSHMANS